MNKLEIENKLKDNKLTEGWTKNIIANLFFLGRGRVISEKEIVNNEGTYSVFSSQTSNKGELGKITSYDFEGEYITWTTDGANAGTVFYRSGRFNCTNVCGTLKARSENIYVKFFAYLLSTQAKKYVSYIGNPKLMNNTVAKILLFFPSFLPEQQKIAKILETVDETIEKTDAIIEKYKQIKQGLMQELLTRGIDENGQIRSEDTHKFKDSPLGRIPEEWEVKRIIDAIGMKRNLIIAGPFGSNLKVSDYKKSGIPLIRLQNIGENRFINKDIKYISKKKAKELYYHSFKNGDVVLAKLGIPVGKTCIIPKNLKFGIVVADVVRIRVIDECADKEFITYILNFNTCRKRLNMEIIGTTRPRVNLTQIRSLQLPLPPIHEQQRIVSILSQIDETVEKEQKYKEKLERIKQGLMEDLLTGKVRVLNVN